MSSVREPRSLPPRPAPAPATIVDRRAETMAGQRSARAGRAAAGVATRTCCPPARDRVHMHFWARYVYVESGEVELTLTDAGRPGPSGPAR